MREWLQGAGTLKFELCTCEVFHVCQFEVSERGEVCEERKNRRFVARVDIDEGNGGKIRSSGGDEGQHRAPYRPFGHYRHPYDEGRDERLAKNSERPIQPRGHEEGCRMHIEGGELRMTARE